MKVENTNAFCVKEFCQRNSIGRTTVYKEIKAGHIQVKKVGRRTLISRAEESRWITKCNVANSRKLGDAS